MWCGGGGGLASNCRSHGACRCDVIFINVMFEICTQEHGVDISIDVAGINDNIFL